jgi:transaldolase / glucose-6-phosphate isomerase
MNLFDELNQMGQSIWYDNIQRRMLNDGSLEMLIRNHDIRGVTSNPAIFQHAIAGSNDYNDALKTMTWAGIPAEPVFWNLAVADIVNALDLFRPLYDESKGLDGYVSIEVNPALANDTEKTVEDAIRLWKLVNRPNLMVKIPATKMGVDAIHRCIAAGLNINVTLIFSVERYAEVVEAYFSGLEERTSHNLPIDSIASVASFFVSRVDGKIDPLLGKIVQSGNEQSQKAANLLGKAAIANAVLAYAFFEETIASARFKKLLEKGAQIQRPLWASTSTKNPAYRDVLYIEELIGAHTVNTVPPQTLDAFRDHGVVKQSLPGDKELAKQQIDELKILGISIDTVTEQLEVEGVKSFTDAYTSLLKTIQERQEIATHELGAELLQKTISRVKQFEKEDFSTLLYKKDPSLWKTDEIGQEEIRSRMNWLDAPTKGESILVEAKKLLSDSLKSGYDRVLLLGMGGSSLAPETLSLMQASSSGENKGLNLRILDSTNPDAVWEMEQWATIETTLFIVSSKSGTTSEVNAFLDFFWKKADKELGGKAGDHFIAITDPDTALEKKAKQLGFRKVISADPNVGGRYSALTAFGLVPAVLCGVDGDLLLKFSQQMKVECSAGISVQSNPGLVLGAILGEAALAGKDKLTFLADPFALPFGAWLEQLIAESSGKNGVGIVPIDQEPINSPNSYPKDRIFIYLRNIGSLDNLYADLLKNGQPVLVFQIDSVENLGRELYRWEIATSAACAVLGVNAFDQPDVQDSKNRTKQNIEKFNAEGILDEGKPFWSAGGVRVYGSGKFDQTSKDAVGLLRNWVRTAQKGDYIAINAYLPRNSQNMQILNRLRGAVQKASGKATTLGFGPRFLHSTGQLHKGGKNNGLFIQIIAGSKEDVVIPGEGLTFGILERAQALGDFDALTARGRRVIRIHLTLAELQNIANNF